VTNSRFADIAATFLNWSRKCSENGNYFPVWGTCKGFQQIITAAICPDVDLDMNSPEYPIATCTSNLGKGTVFQKGPDWDNSHFIQTLPKTMTEKLLLGNICGFSLGYQGSISYYTYLIGYCQVFWQHEKYQNSVFCYFYMSLKFKDDTLIQSS